MWERETQTWMMRRNGYHIKCLGLQCFSEWFEIKTAHDPTQVGMADRVTGLSPQIPPKSVHQSIREMAISPCLPVLVHGESTLKGMGLPAAPPGLREATFWEGASSLGSVALGLLWFLTHPSP